METVPEDLIVKLINEHEKEKYFIMQEYYEGRNIEILNKKSKGSNDPNNQIINNFAGFITDVSVGYFMGKPVTYTTSVNNETMLEELTDIFKYNDEADENLELAKIQSIKGTAFEILYTDEREDGMVIPRFDVIDPDNIIIAYDKSISKEPSLAIYYYEDVDLEKDETSTVIYLYTDKSVFNYVLKDDALTLIDVMDHHFDLVPIVEFPNNDERQGDFEKVMTLIDAYDNLQSNDMDDSEYHADAYLKIINMSATDADDIQKMKSDRVIKLDEDGDADWLIKNIDHTGKETLKNRIQEDIHKLSMTPNLTDERFAHNLSGVALEFKLWGLEQSSSQKERKFKKGLQRRIELIFNFLKNKARTYEWRDVGITFTRNIPQNLKEIAEVAVKLKGTVSDSTVLSMLPMVDDVAMEQEKIEQEERKAQDNIMKTLYKDIEKDKSAYEPELKTFDLDSAKLY